MHVIPSTRRVTRHAASSLATSSLALLIAACGGDGTAPDAQVARVEVSAPVVNGLPRTAIGIGETVRLTAAALTESGDTVRGVTVTWSALPATVATVDAGGEVRGIALGTTFVQASVGAATGGLGIVVLNAGQPAAVVEMPGDTFSPARLEIRVNERVAFSFPARPHNVIFDKGRAGLPADIQQTANQIVQRQFPTAGTFPYACTLHPGMNGEIVVR
ncbi:MAG TPA: plastocyanin/azurin family copper-binding protein [Gemmatimonadaceae bacterium]|nr:plastocyanin/azurin family copper-binding protein [Gemmatimonadaceae bacterium]